MVQVVVLEDQVDAVRVALVAHGVDAEVVHLHRLAFGQNTTGSFKRVPAAFGQREATRRPVEQARFKNTAIREGDEIGVFCGK